MTVRRIFNWIIGVPVAAVAVAFAVANRQWTMISFDPFNRDLPFASISMPLWVLFFCGIFVGLIAGWIAAWLAQGKWRKAAKEARIDLIRAQHEQQRLKHAVESSKAVAVKDASL